MTSGIDIRPLGVLVETDLRRLVSGYTANEKYVVRKTHSPTGFLFSLELTPLATPYRKVYDHLDAATLEQFRPYPAMGYSFAAYAGAECVGLALGEPRVWNKTLWVHELHVAASHQGCGIGRRLVEALAVKAHSAGLRALVCETQNTNVPALRFYFKTGFQLEGIDLTYYTNEDYPDHEIAVFVKKRIEARPAGA